MATQLIFGLIIFFVSYVGTIVLLIETLMWVMRRLDGPTASATTSKMGSSNVTLHRTLSIQANLGRTYQPEGCARNPIEAYQLDFPINAIANRLH